MESVVAKVVGVISGSILGLVFIPPRSIPGFIRRALAALVFGGVFGGPALHVLEWEATTDNIVASYCIAAFSSWWIMGSIKRIAESFGSKES